MKNVEVIAYIQQLQNKTTEKRIMSAVERREWLTDLIKDKKAKDTDRLKALDILNKIDDYVKKFNSPKLSGQFYISSTKYRRYREV